MSQADSFDGEENTGIWRLSEEDPFSSVTIACEKALPETKDVSLNFLSDLTKRAIF